jgi:DNA-binding PadR family transcriptional regulator
MTSLRPLRLTKPTLGVLEVLAEASDADPVWGLRICEIADLGPGTVYPILERLSTLGWLDYEWEDDQPSGRPRRRYFRLNGLGRSELLAAQIARSERRRRWTPNVGPILKSS